MLGKPVSLRDVAGLPLPASAARDTSSIREGAMVNIVRLNDRYAEVPWGDLSVGAVE